MSTQKPNIIGKKEKLKAAGDFYDITAAAFEKPKGEEGELAIVWRNYLKSRILSLGAMKYFKQ